MARVGRSSRAPAGVTLVPVPARKPSGLLVLAAVLVVLVVFVGIALLWRSGGEAPGSQAALGGPSLAVPTASAALTATPVATPPPTAPGPIGTPPPRVSVSLGPVPTCPPGTSPGEPGPVDQARPAGFVGHLAFDRRAGRLLALAEAGTGPVETWTFDVCSNTWIRMHPNREPPSFAFRPLVYDVDSDLTIGVDYGPDGGPLGRVWAYDLATDTWTEKAGPTDKELRAYDPLTGLVIADGPIGDLWNYDVETATWSPIGQPSAGEAGVSSYDASVDRFIVLGNRMGGPSWLFDIRTRTWSRSGAPTPIVERNWAVPTVTYDEAAERTVFVGSSAWASYDAAADRWEVLPEAGGSLAYDPLNRRLVVLGGTGIACLGDVVAFDLVTRECAVLLGPGNG
jgi:hypothetical protein